MEGRGRRGRRAASCARCIPGSQETCLAARAANPPLREKEGSSSVARLRRPRAVHPLRPVRPDGAGPRRRAVPRARRGAKSRGGAGAVGGVVELVPRRPRTDRPVADARLSAGSFGTFGASSSATVPWSSEGGGLVALQVDRSAGDFPYRQQLTPEIANSPYYEFTRANADSWRGSALLRGGWPMTGETGGD